MNKYILGKDIVALIDRFKDEGIEVRYNTSFGAIEYSFNVENLDLKQLEIVKKILSIYKKYKYCNIAISTGGISTNLGEFENVASVSFIPMKEYGLEELVGDIKSACYSKENKIEILVEKLIALLNVLKSKNVVLRIEVVKEEEEYTIKVVKKLENGKEEFLQGAHYKKLEEVVKFLSDLKIAYLGVSFPFE